MEFNTQSFKVIFWHRFHAPLVVHDFSLSSRVWEWDSNCIVSGRWEMAWAIRTVYGYVLLMLIMLASMIF